MGPHRDQPGRSCGDVLCKFGISRLAVPCGSVSSRETVIIATDIPRCCGVLHIEKVLRAGCYGISRLVEAGADAVADRPICSGCRRLCVPSAPVSVRACANAQPDKASERQLLNQASTGSAAACAYCSLTAGLEAGPRHELETATEPDTHTWLFAAPAWRFRYEREGRGENAKMCE